MPTWSEAKTPVPVLDSLGQSINLASRSLDSKLILFMQPVQHGATQERFMRYLDTNGDGTGTKAATVDHSGATEEYKLAPAAGTILRVETLSVVVCDATSFDPDQYGNIDLSAGNGIEIHLKDGMGSILDLTDGVPIKASWQWHAIADVSVPDISTDSVTGSYSLRALLRFDRMSVPLRVSGDESEYLSVDLHDDFSGLVGHYFCASGYVE